MRSAMPATSLRVWIAGLSNRKLPGRFSGWTAVGMMQERTRCSWFSFLGSMFSDDGTNAGDEEVQVVLLGFGIIRRM